MSDITKTIVTGASGFIGSALCCSLEGKKDLIKVSRLASSRQVNQFYIPEVTGSTDWTAPLRGCSSLIHFAARVHVRNHKSVDSLSAFREVNVEGTANLARQAAEAGLKRFIFLSSVKVNGEFSVFGAPFSYNDAPAPEDSYGVSKQEAEQALKEVCAETGMEYVIIRPPLVYGPGVKANFLSMLKWVSLGVPLPLGCIRKNKRSLVYVENLVELIKACIEHPAAANQTFLVSDDDDVSTQELLVRAASALDVKSRLLNIPPSWLGLAVKLLGKKDIEQRLCASLQVDIAHTKNTLNWTPPFSMQEGLRKTAEWYKARN